MSLSLSFILVPLSFYSLSISFFLSLPFSFSMFFFSLSFYLSHSYFLTIFLSRTVSVTLFYYISHSRSPDLSLSECSSLYLIAQAMKKQHRIHPPPPHVCLSICLSICLSSRIYLSVWVLLNA